LHFGYQNAKRKNKEQKVKGQKMLDNKCAR